MELAHLAKGAYSPGQEVEGYSVDKELSNNNRTAYVDNNTGGVVLSFRGTNPRNWRDVTTDLMLGLGLQDKSNRVKTAKAVTQKAIDKYGRDKVKVTGHSLGGSTALAVSNKLGVQGVGFNPYLSPIDAMFRKRNYSKAQVYQTKADPVSLMNPLTKGLRVRFVKQKKRDPHTIHNFTA